MAQKRTTKVLIPELTRQLSKYEPAPRTCLLTLETDKAYRGGVDCAAHVGWADKVGFVQVELGIGGGGDFRKVYVVRPGVATQKRIDQMHEEIFTPERIEQIKDEVRAYYGYQAKQPGIVYHGENKNIAAHREEKQTSADGCTSATFCTTCGDWFKPVGPTPQERRQQAAQDNQAAMGAAIKELTDSDIDTSTALRMLNID